MMRKEKHRELEATKMNFIIQSSSRVVDNRNAFYEPFEHLQLRYRINVIISIERDKCLDLYLTMRRKIIPL